MQPSIMPMLRKRNNTFQQLYIKDNQKYWVDVEEAVLVEKHDPRQLQFEFMDDEK